MKRLIILALLAIASLAGAAQANDAFKFDGNHLLKACSATERFGEGRHIQGWEENADFYMCHAYMRAVLDTMGTMNMAFDLPNHVCIPDEVDQGQAGRVFVKYLREHPAELHLSASLLLMAALTEAFPCAESRANRPTQHF